MSAFGKMTELTYVNDSTAVPISAGNKNEEQRVLKLCDTELSRSKEYNFYRMKNLYYQKNTKLIDDFDDATDWSAISSTTVSDDTTHYNLNFSAVKFLENDNTSSYIGMTKSISSLDLTEFNDGGASDADDFIFIVFYISDYTKFYDFTIKLGTDNSHNYTIQFNPDGWSRSGYYCLYAKKSDFTDYSGPGWDNITWIYCEAYTYANAQNEYITMQALQLVRKDPDDDTKPNPFQSYRADLSAYVADIQIPFEPWGLFWDKSIQELIMYEVEQYDFTGNQFGVLVREDLIEFFLKAKVYPKEDDSGILSFTWRVNDENYIEAYIQADTLYMRKREGGSTTYVSLALDNAIGENRLLNVSFEKQGQNLIFNVDRGRETVKRLVTSTTISASSEGDLYFGHYSTNQFSTLVDFTLSHNPNCSLENFPMIIKNNTEDSSNTSASYTNSSDMWVDLSPNQLYEIEFNLVFDCAATTPHIDTAWDVSNVTLFGKICTIGMAVDSTNNAKAEYGKYAAYSSFTNNIYFGSDGDVYCQFRMLVQTGPTPGYIRFKFRQRNTDGSNPVTLDTATYMKITPVRIVGT